MIQLVLAILFFVVLHVGVAGSPLRRRLVEKLGENGYRGAFSLLSLLGLFWLAHAYRAAGYVETWGQLAWFKPVAAILMLAAFVLAVLGVATPNPTAVGGETLLLSDAPARGVHRITRHPFLWGVELWALTHLIANGDLASLLLFGSLGAMVPMGMRSIDAKRRKACGQHWERYAAATSIVPFLAIKQGRNQFVAAEFKWWPLIVALLLYMAMMHFHLALFGVSPLL